MGRNNSETKYILSRNPYHPGTYTHYKSLSHRGWAPSRGKQNLYKKEAILN